MSRKKIPDLHLHSYDLFDSQNAPEDVCRRLKELGSEGFALTQHGVLSGIEPMREAAKKYGLKFIPGVETYYHNEGDLFQRQHLIILAKDDIGYQAIGKAVTKANNKDGFAVMDDQILHAFFAPGSLGHGHVIATSACVQGPLGVIIRQNDEAARKIKEIEKKTHSLSKAVECLSEIQAQVRSVNEELKQLKDLKKTLKDAAEFGATGKRNLLDKRFEQGKISETQYIEKKKTLHLRAEKEADAKKKLPDVESKIASCEKELKAHKEKLKKAKAQVDSFQKAQSEIRKLQKQILSEVQLEHALKKKASAFLEVFGKDAFFIEIQYHGIPVEKDVYPVLVRLSNKMQIPLVATNDVHLVTGDETDRLRRQIMRFLRFGNAWEEEAVGDAELYIKTDKELSDMLSQIFDASVISEAMANTWKIFDACNVAFQTASHNPKFTDSSGKTSLEIFHDEIEAGMKWRFPDGFPDERYQKRLSYEMGIIEKMGYVDYHLIVKDFLAYARALAPVPPEFIKDAPLTIDEAKNWVSDHNWTGGISTGPGRGSAVGSLVCYLLGITALDPLQYDLLFERFLNPERVSMPDIDSDIAKLVRPQTIRYVQHKYGEDAVCGIMTMTFQAPRGAVRIAAKAYGYSRGEDGKYLRLSDEIAKLIPDAPKTSFASKMENGATVFESLQDQYAMNTHALKILEWAKTIEGVFTSYGAHAAGIVISDNKDVSDYLPLRWNKQLHEWTTQCDMVTTESKGLLKMDFLGLKTLDIMSETLLLIQQRTGRLIAPERDIPMDDADVYRSIFQSGATDSVFQFESAGMKQMLMRFKPDCFEDLIILVSMFRPGPLQYLDGVIEVKHGKSPDYLVPQLIPILEKTYSAIVYQEQVMEIFQKLAGYTLGQADQVRRYMSKKKADKLSHERKAFVYGDPDRNIHGCQALGIDPDKANALFDQMEDFSKYAFNKSHAAAYAANSYYTAYLKYHYPAEYLKAAMNWAEDKSAEDRALPGLMHEAKKFGVEVLPPDINLSDIAFSVHDDAIRPGLGSIQSVGQEARLIIEERKKNGRFESFSDFQLRIRIRRNSLEALIHAGAFDCFSKNRSAVLDLAKKAAPYTDRIKDKQNFIKKAEAILPYVDALDTKPALDEKLAELNLGSFLTKSTTRSALAKRIENAQTAIDDARKQIRALRINASIFEDFETRMFLEHDLLGAFITAHPLDAFTVDTPEICELPNKGRVSVTGVVTSVRVLYTKKDHRPMAMMTIEDRSGSLPVILYPASYLANQDLVQKNMVLTLRGEIQERGEESVQLVCESVAKGASHQHALVSVKPTWSDVHTERLKAQFAQDIGFRLILRVEGRDLMIDTGIFVSEEFVKEHKGVFF